MLINKDKTVKDIQEEFNLLFPGLQLHFYTRKHADRAGSPQADEIDGVNKLGSLKTFKKDGFMSIFKTMAVSELEQSFENNFGLYVQVFRQSKDLWLQTTSTDDWTLEEQNKKGIHSNQETLKDGY